MSTPNKPTVRVTEQRSRLHNLQATWHPDELWTDRSGREWHLLEFADGFRIRFPRDEFEEVADHG